MKLVRQAQCFIWKNLGCQDGRRAYICYSYFWRGKKQNKTCSSLPHRAFLEKTISFSACSYIIICLLFPLRHSGTFWATRVNRAHPPHTLALWWMACLPCFPILGLTCFLLPGSVGKLSNLSPQLFHFHQKEWDRFPTKENWDSNIFLTGI